MAIFGLFESEGQIHQSGAGYGLLPSQVEDRGLNHWPEVTVLKWDRHSGRGCNNLEKVQEITSGNTAIQRVSSFFTRIMRRYLPDPYVFAIILTLVTLVLGAILQHKTISQMAVYWGDGFWALLAFAMQMVLIVVTGYALAKTPLVDSLLVRISGIPKTPRGAIITATVVAGLASYINWGFGLILGTLLAQKLAVKIRGIHYPLLIASAYSGWILYGLGISATIPITMATPANPFLKMAGGLLPLSHTIFQPAVIIDALILIIALPIVNSLIHPSHGVIDVDPSTWDSGQKKSQSTEAITPAERMERSPILNILIGIIGVGYIVYHFASGGGLDLNTINAIFLFLGIILHGSPRRYIDTVNDGVKSVGGIVLQFPFYAGIMGMMAGSGLVITISKWFVDISTTHTLAFWGFISSFIINFFAPSSGGHWVIQGPFMIEAAKQIGANLGKVTQAVQMGSSWNDLLQPFWLLPIISLARLNVRQIMGYTVMAWIVMGIVFSATILLW